MSEFGGGSNPSLSPVEEVIVAENAEAAMDAVEALEDAVEIAEAIREDEQQRSDDNNKNFGSQVNFSDAGRNSSLRINNNDPTPQNRAQAIGTVKVINAMGEDIGPIPEALIRAETSVIDFHDEEGGDVEFFRGPLRKKPYKWRCMYIFSICSFSLSLGSIWRFPSVFINLSRMAVDSNESNGHGLVAYSMWNVLVPLSIILLFVVWPLLVAEAASAQLVMGGVLKSYGSIAVRLRSSGIAFIAAMGMLTFVPYLGAVCFSHLLYVFNTPPMSEVSQYNYELGIPVCTYTGKTGHDIGDWPYWHQKPGEQSTLSNTAALRLLRGAPSSEFADVVNAADQTLSPSFLKVLEDTNSVISRSEKTYFDSLEGRLPVHSKSSNLNLSESLAADAHTNTQFPPFGGSFPSMSLYCGETMLEKVLTDHDFFDIELATVNSKWDDFGNFFSWEIIVGLITIWLFAFGFVMFGNRVMQWIRPIIFFFAIASLLAAGIMASDTGPWESSELRALGKKSWKDFLTTFDGKSLRRPEIWSILISQSLFALSLGQGVVPNYSHKAEKFTENCVADQQLNMTLNTLYNIGCGLIVALCARWGGSVLTLGGTASTYTDWLNQMTENSALKESWLAFDTAFGDPSMNGAGWIFCVYLSVFFVACNQLASLLDVVTTTFAGLRATNLITALWCGFFSLIFLGLNVIMSWAVGYPFAITLQHFNIDVLLPFVAYLEVTALGWFVNYKKMENHLGKLAFWTHASLYHVGVWCFALCTAFLFDFEKYAGVNSENTWDENLGWVRIIGMIIGLVLIVFSILIPPFISNSNDFDGNEMSLGTKFNFVFWRNVETLRHQINVAFCHNSCFKLTCCWSILLKYVCPLGFAFAFAMPICQGSQTTEFSAYFPWNYEDNLRLDGARMKTVYLWMGALVPLCAVLVWIVSLCWPKLLSRCTSVDASPVYYDPLDAAGLYADFPQTQYERGAQNEEEARAAIQSKKSSSRSWHSD